MATGHRQRDTLVSRPVHDMTALLREFEETFETGRR
jgi:hypothetical protein